MPQGSNFAQEHNLTKTWEQTTAGGPRIGYHVSAIGDSRPNHHNFLRSEIGPEAVNCYYSSKNYKQIFEEEWDMVVNTFALSETPKGYWMDILKNIKTKNCFFIDYSGHDMDFEPALRKWANKFQNQIIFYDRKVDGGNTCRVWW